MNIHYHFSLPLLHTKGISNLSHTLILRHFWITFFFLKYISLCGLIFIIWFSHKMLLISFLST